MTERQGTKDNHQREEEEAERLVRPNPKIKPPRRDRRRERMDAERDEDTAGDPDLKGDPDLSLNYKSIGGSVVDRVAVRFLNADMEEENPSKGGVPPLWQKWLEETKGSGKKKVPNPNPETRAERPEVSYSTALKIPSFYQEALKDYRAWAAKTDEEEPGSAPAQVEGTPSKVEPSKEEAPAKNEPAKAELPSPERLAENARLLRDLASQNPLTESKLKTFLTGELGQMAEKNPSFPAKAFFPEISLPPGIKTIGDIADALKTKPAKAPKQKSGPKEELPAAKEPAPSSGESKGEPPSKGKAPSADDALGQKIKDFVSTLPEESRPLGELFTQFLQTMKDQKGPPKDAPKESPVEAPKNEKPTESPKAPTKKIPEEPWAGRRKVEQDEIEQAQTLIARALPGRVASKFMGLHPDDAKQLVSQYDGMKKLGPIPDQDFDSSLKKMKESFTLDPKEVPPPKTWKKGDREVPFEALSSMEQADALRSHQLQVVAYNISMRERAIATLKGRGVSSSIAAQTVDSQLAKPKVGDTPEEHAKLAAEREESIKKAAQHHFIAGAASKDSPMSPQVREKTLKGAKSLPLETQRLAFAQLQADDYRAVASKYLGGSDPESQLSERDPPRVFKAKLSKAMAEFEKRRADYPEDAIQDNPQPEKVFREKLLSRLRDTDSHVLYDDVSKHFAKIDADRYDRQVKAFEKDQSQYQKDNASYAKSFLSWQDRQEKSEEKEGANPYRATKRTSEEPPKPPKEPKTPVMPDNYYETRRAEAPLSKRDVSKQVEEMLKRTEETGEDVPVKSLPQRVKDKVKDKLKSRQDKLKDEEWEKTFNRKDEKKDRKEDERARKVDEEAEKLLRKYENTKTKKSFLSPYSFYGCRDLTMGIAMPSEFESRAALYHGIEPEKGSNYAGWQQAHASEMGAADSAILLAGAREWLKSSILSKFIEGMNPDARFRAALDLSIRDVSGGKYGSAVAASLYNELLSKLSGDHSVPLGTIGREASLRAEVRVLASNLVEIDPGLAYDLLAYAERTSVASVSEALPVKEVIASEDTYEALRTTVIRVASQDPSTRMHLLPVLRLIKTIDDVRVLRASSDGE